MNEPKYIVTFAELSAALVERIMTDESVVYQDEVKIVDFVDYDYSSFIHTVFTQWWMALRKRPTDDEVERQVVKLTAHRKAAEIVNQRERRELLELALGGLAEPESMADLMTAEDADEVPLVRDLNGTTMLRMGNDASFLAPQKAGKTETTDELHYSLVTGAPVLGAYPVTPLPEDRIVVSLDGENDRTDRKTQWAPLWPLMTPEQQARVVTVPLGDVPCAMLDPEFLEMLFDYAKPLIQGRPVGFITADTLQTLTSMSDEDLRNPAKAVRWRREVLPRLREEWGDETTTTMTLMHSARYLQKMAFDIAPLGGPHWDAQLSPHWRMPLDPVLQHKGDRLFAVMPSRGSLRSDPQYVAKTSSGRLVVDLSRSEEAQAVLLGGTRAAVAKARTKTKDEKTDELVLRCLPAASGAYEGSGAGLVAPVAALAKADGLTKGEYKGRRQDLSESLKRLHGRGQADSVVVSGNVKYRRTEAGDLLAKRLESDSPEHLVSTAAATYGDAEGE